MATSKKIPIHGRVILRQKQFERLLIFLKLSNKDLINSISKRSSWWTSMTSLPDGTNLSLPSKFEITWSLKSGTWNIKFWWKIEVWLWKCVWFNLIIWVQNGTNPYFLNLFVGSLMTIDSYFAELIFDWTCSISAKLISWNRGHFSIASV